MHDQPPPHGHTAPLIETERPGDGPAIRTLHEAAFGGPLEAEIVDELRAGGHVVEGGSLVAFDADGSIAGHVLLSQGSLHGEDWSVRRVWMLGPIGVRPDRQGRGVGSALMRAAIHLAILRGQPLLCLLGHDTYYPRFGFEPARGIGILPPDDTWPDAHWMALRLPAWTPDIRGMARYPPPFGV